MGNLLSQIHSAYAEAKSIGNDKAAYHLRVAAGFAFKEMFDIKNSQKRYTLTNDEVREGQGRNGKVGAVVMYRRRTGLGLIESKKAVEEYFEKHGLQFRSHI